MFDTFPYDEWSEDIAGFWTRGPGNSTGTYILTAIPMAVSMYVPVEEPGPHVQKPAMSSLHSSYGNVSNIA